MTSEIQTRTTAEFASKYSLATRLIATLATVTLASGINVAHNRQKKHEPQAVCLEQACGRTVLQDLLVPLTPAPEVSISPSLKPIHSAAPKPAPSKAEKPTPGHSSSRQVNPNLLAVTLQGKGIDISYPQEPDFSLDSKSHKVIAKNMPSHPDFVVVGVNNGHPYSQNPAFDLETAWAHQVAGDDVSFYVNLANTSSNPVQAEADGKQIAYYDLKLIKTDPALPTPTTVMLDVETANSWQGLHLDTTNKADTAKIIAAQASNRAAAEGAVEEFHEHGIRVVLYSAKNMWARIMGSVSPDSVLKVPEWHAPGGAAALRDSPFIAGNRVVMGQTVAPYPAHSKHYLDIDFARPKG